MVLDLVLRDVTPADIAVYFEHQSDPTARRMAAFTVKDPSDRAAFDAHWTRILADERIVKRTILVGGRVAGSVASFEQAGAAGGPECPNCGGDHEADSSAAAVVGREVTYWIGREFWGRGVATRALAMFLEELAARPLFARAAQDNCASIRVLAKCGFKLIGHERGFANARGEEIDEVVMILEAPPRASPAT